MGRIKFPDAIDEHRKPLNSSEFLFGRKIGLYRVERDCLFHYYPDADSLYPAVDLFEGGRCIAMPLSSANFVEYVIRKSCINEMPLTFSEFFRMTTDPYYGATRRYTPKEEG